MYSYDLQYPEFDWNQVKEMGPVDGIGALEVFRTFPFAELLEKTQLLPEGTAPTIIFRSHSDKANLWVCLRAANYYEILLENDGETVTVGPTEGQLLIEAIKAFFAGERSDLFNRLAGNPKAVTQRRFWNRLKSIFSH